MSSFDLGEIFLWSLSEQFALASVFPPQHLLRWEKKGENSSVAPYLKLLMGFRGFAPKGQVCWDWALQGPALRDIPVSLLQAKKQLGKIPL